MTELELNNNLTVKTAYLESIALVEMKIQVELELLDIIVKQMQ